MGLVRSIAQRFADRGTEMEDLMQIGVMGMLKAIKSFDFSYQTAFSTYAVPLIIGEIRRFLRDDGMIKVGREIKKRGAAIQRAKEAFFAAHGSEGTSAELAALLGMSARILSFPWTPLLRCIRSPNPSAPTAKISHWKTASQTRKILPRD